MSMLDTSRPTGRGKPPSPTTPGATLSVAYTPDSDDAFNYYAWEHDRVSLCGRRANFFRNHIIALNRAAAREEYDVVAISSAAYPQLADRYCVLSVGNSVGRGYGPVLVSRQYGSVLDLRGKRVAVAGVVTTGGVLAAMYCPAAEFVEMPYDRIADAIVAGEVDAGVMIHEELLAFPQKGLQRVCDLGATWCEDTRLPLPVGLNVVHRRLGRPLAAEVAATCVASLKWGLDHRDEAMLFASQFGRGCSQRHVELFSNGDTLCLADDVRQAMQYAAWVVSDQI